MIRKTSIILTCLLSLVVLLPAGPHAAAKAYNPFNGVDCSNNAAASSAVCQTSGHTTVNNPVTGLILNIVNIIAYVAGAAAIIIIIVSALRFVTSGSDTSKGGRVDDDVVNARRSLVSALIGLAVIVLAKVIITYIVKRV